MSQAAASDKNRTLIRSFYTTTTQQSATIPSTGFFFLKARLNLRVRNKLFNRDIALRLPALLAVMTFITSLHKLSQIMRRFLSSHSPPQYDRPIRRGSLCGWNKQTSSKVTFFRENKIETKYNFFFFFTFKEWEKYKSHVSELASDENKRRRPTVTRSVARLGKPHKNRRERATKAVSDVF